MSQAEKQIQKLQNFLDANPRIVVLTGAGISLAAGIPTYRDQEGQWRHSEPIKYQQFLNEPASRRRYWARSMRGWPAVRDAQPTAAHHSLTAMSQVGKIDTLITQNVDRLHQRAACEQVVDLHGRLDRVRCLQCQQIQSRDELQTHLLLNNSSAGKAAAPRPDGDSELVRDIEAQFQVPECNRCGGILMPDVVFFGDSVPKVRVQACMDAIERVDALLAIGSSLQVFSGFRFCRRANVLGKPLAIINPGVTRADDIAQLKVEMDCQVLLQAIADNRRW